MPTVNADKLKRFFEGDDPFFDGVSERMAYALPLGHPDGLRTCSDSASDRPENSNRTEVDFWANERALNFNAYDGNPANAKTFAAGDCILLGQYPPCASTGCITVIRTAAGESVDLLDATTLAAGELLDDDGKPVGTVSAQPCFVPAGEVTAEFPAFDLYATRVDGERFSADPFSYHTIHLAAAADMADPKTAHAPAAWIAKQQTEGCSEWLIWAKLAGDVPANSGVKIEMPHVIAGSGG